MDKINFIFPHLLTDAKHFIRVLIMKITRSIGKKIIFKEFLAYFNSVFLSNYKATFYTIIFLLYVWQLTTCGYSDPIYYC